MPCKRCLVKFNGNGFHGEFLGSAMWIAMKSSIDLYCVSFLFVNPFQSHCNLREICKRCLVKCSGFRRESHGSALCQLHWVPLVRVWIPSQNHCVSQGICKRCIVRCNGFPRQCLGLLCKLQWHALVCVGISSEAIAFTRDLKRCLVKFNGFHRESLGSALWIAAKSL